MSVEICFVRAWTLTVGTSGKCGSRSAMKRVCMRKWYQGRSMEKSVSVFKALYGNKILWKCDAKGNFEVLKNRLANKKKKFKKCHNEPGRAFKFFTYRENILRKLIQITSYMWWNSLRMRQLKPPPSILSISHASVVHLNVKDASQHPGRQADRHRCFAMLANLLSLLLLLFTSSCL